MATRKLLRDTLPPRATIKANVIRRYLESTPEQRTAGRRWYSFAYKAAARLGRRNGLTTRAAAGIVAALSPQTSWRLNLANAEAVAGGAEVGYLPVQLGKAADIREGADPSEVLRGPKEKAFFSNIAAPRTAGAVTVDRHAAMVALASTDVGRCERTLRGAGVYDIVADAYREAALALGELPHVVQAVTWVTFRENERAISDYLADGPDPDNVVPF